MNKSFLLFFLQVFFVSFLHADNIQLNESRNAWLSKELSLIATETANNGEGMTFDEVKQESLQLVEYLNGNLIKENDSKLVDCFIKFPKNIERIIPCMKKGMWVVIGPGMVKNEDLTLTFNRSKNWVYFDVTFKFKNIVTNPIFYVDDKEVGYSQRSSFNFTYNDLVTEDLKKGNRLRVKQFGKENKMYSLLGLTKAVNQSIQ